MKKLGRGDHPYRNSEPQTITYRYPEIWDSHGDHEFSFENDVLEMFTWTIR